MEKLIILFSLLILSSCASLTNDSHVPIALSFSDGSEGKCQLNNKRFSEEVNIPSTPKVRRSDDALRFRCNTVDEREVAGSIPSTVGAKIVASAFFLDFGITDAITDMHREYPASFVIPIKSNKK